MVQTIQAQAINLLDLETSVGLQLIQEEQFLREWQDNLREIKKTASAE